MASMTNDGRAAIEKIIECPRSTSVWVSVVNGSNFDHVFDIDRCVRWIVENNFKKICIQIPDEILLFATKISKRIEELIPHCRTYVLADSTYGSCCVDEKTSQHIPEASALIHFGQSCLSESSGRIPVLYVFTNPPIDVGEAERLFRATFGKEEKVIMAYDVIFEKFANELYARLCQDYALLLKSTLVVPGGNQDGTCESAGLIRHRRRIPVRSDEDLESYTVFAIGSRSLSNLMMAMPRNVFRIYDPLSTTSEAVSTRTSSLNKLLMKRNYYIEKVKDAQVVGILVGTLVVQNYLGVIERLKTILRNVNKKFHVVSIGEINPCKLANFMDIECFVFVGCPEVVSYYLSDEAKGQFFQPILTPYDVELAFCTSKDDSAWGQEYIIDWAYLIQKGEPKVKIGEEDMSLITGGLRSVVTEPSGNIVHWQGLDVNEQFSTETNVIHQGRSGIAASYKDEPIVP